MLKRAQNRDKWNDEIWAYVLALIYVFSNQKLLKNFHSKTVSF